MARKYDWDKIDDEDYRHGKLICCVLVCSFLVLSTLLVLFILWLMRF